MTQKNQTQNPAAEDVLRHEWEPVGFTSDKCKHCGKQAFVGDMNIDSEACPERDPAAAISKAIASDSAVNEAAHVIADHSRRAPNAPLSEEWIRLTIRYAIQEAIARDRAERDAALDAAKDALLAAGSYYEWDGAGENEPCVVKQRAALAQIEALAGKGGAK